MIIKRLIKSMAIVFFCFQLLSCANSLSGNSEKEQELFEQIKVGMHKDEVIKILGQPDSKFVDTISEKYSHYFYFTSNKWGRSELPYVEFDSTGKVTTSYYY